MQSPHAVAPEREPLERDARVTLGRVARAPRREVPLADESTAAKDLERDYLLFPCRMISEKARVI